MRLAELGERFKDILYVIDRISSDDEEMRDEAKSRLVILCDDLCKEQLHRHANESQKRMTNAQRNRLWEMCGNYNVPFRENDYYLNPSTGWVEGWIGGVEHALPQVPDNAPVVRKIPVPRTIYVGVSPEGESHT